VRFEVILVVAMYEDKCLEECDQSAWWHTPYDFIFTLHSYCIYCEI